jgi:hypothetical protein
VLIVTLNLLARKEGNIAEKEVAYTLIIHIGLLPMLITVDLDVDPALPGFEVVRISNYGDLTPSRQQHLT